MFGLKPRRVRVAITVCATGEWIEQATNTGFNIADSMRNILHNSGVQCRSAKDFLSIQLFRTTFEFLANVSVTLVHVCSICDFWKVHFLSKFDRTSQRWTPKHEPRKDQPFEVWEPRVLPYRTKWRVHQNVVYGTNIRRFF